MFLLCELYVAYIEDYNGASYLKYTRIFTSKEEAELYQETEKRDYDISYKILPLDKYLQLVYSTGKEYGEDDVIRNVQFHIG